MCKRTSRTVVCRLHAGAQDQLPPAASTRQQALLTSSPKLILVSRGHTSPHTPCLRVLVRRHEYFNTFSNVTLLVRCCHIRHIRKLAYARDSQFQSRPITRPRPRPRPRVEALFYFCLLDLVLVEERLRTSINDMILQTVDNDPT